MSSRHLRVARALAVLALPISVLAPAAASGSALPVTGNLVPPGTGDVRVAGNGPAFAPGDVDGDGRADLALSFSNRTELYLGAPGTAPVGPTTTPSRLITVQHDPGTVEVPAGDVDGDGRDDLLTLRCDGTSGDAVLRTIPAGRRYVGAADQRSPRVRFVFPGDPAGDCVRSAVALGDLDADGFDDVLLDWVPPNSRRDEGTEYGPRRTVVFGAATLPARIDLDSPGALGYRLRGRPAGGPLFLPTPAGWTGSWESSQGWLFADVRAAGDVNGDGRDDYALVRGDESGPTYLYVVLGSSSRADVVMSARTGRAFRVGPVGTMALIAPLGDFDGDGFDDLAVSMDDLATSRIVRGRAATTDLGISAASPVIDGQIIDADPAGDIDGDGLGDASVRLDSGSVYGALDRTAVLFGRTTTAAIRVPPAGGAFATGLSLPTAVVPLGGDWNGDGRADLYLPGGGVLFGYGPGASPEVVDTKPPVLTGLAVTRGVWRFCGILGQTQTVMGTASYRLDEAATLQVSVVHRGSTRTASVIVPASSTGTPLPNSLISAGSGPAAITIVPVDASGNRGAPSYATIDVAQTTWDWRGC